MPATEREDRNGGALEAAQPAPTATETPFTIFDKRQKWFIVFIVSVAATFSGFASNIYFPALPTIAADLDVSAELVTLTVTSYLVLQGLAPSLWGPVSDVRGRRVAYLCTFVVFLGACIGLALTRRYAGLVALRCLQSAGSASTIAVGAGVIGDMTTRADRGGFMGVFQAGLLTPVAVGPILGGARRVPPSAAAGAAGDAAVAGGEWQRRRAGEGRLAREVSVEGVSEDDEGRVGSGGTAACAAAAKEHRRAGTAAYSGEQMSITAMSSLFKDRYGLSEMQIGLTFIANGVGCIVGTLINGRILDADYSRVKAQLAAAGDSASDGHDDDVTSFPIEKARLRLLPIFSLIQCLSILLFGWTIQYPRSVPIAIPIMSTFATGWAAISTVAAISTYLVDVFPDRSAAATASLNLARCLFAAGGTSFVMPMIGGIDVGWTFTICVAVQLLALVGPLVQYRYAGKWRMEMEKAKVTKASKTGH
ncbi:hypothetical protein G3M48_004659 [Beauveria asiatica]|uniref:Major facilitator superfamily (MFS) profile domain-containing protein n=1 Tax=Beauveria asiatica TaxID=1069075 RepID=A0AAW0RTP2_9HYPO